MSEGHNHVTLVGNLGADPELRFTANGKAVLNLRLAINENWYDKETKERQENTEWMGVVVWGTRAEGLAKFLTKGRQILVTGKLRTSTYDKDGQTHYRTEVHADDVVPLGKSDGGGEQTPAQGVPRAAAKKTAQRPQTGTRRPAQGVPDPDNIPY